MFGGNLKEPKYVKLSKSSKRMVYDIQLPTITPGIYGHMGRQPNTDYHIRYAHYKQKMVDGESQLVADMAKRLLKNAVKAKYDKHVQKKTFQRCIEERFKEKIKAFDMAISKRRERLKELLCKEEQEWIQETIDKAQKGIATKMEDMKNKAQLLKAQREVERVKIVNEKRIQQYMNSCMELRPVLAKRNLLDTKNTQLEQMRENEMRREAERELDSMWYNLMVKEMEAKMEREVQDVLKYNKAMDETMEIWEKQLQGKQLLKEEAEKIAAEDRMEMIKLQDELRREEIEALDSKRRKRNQVAKELREQIAVQERFLSQRKNEENALNNALSHLAEVEIERERLKIHDTTSLAKRETAIYRNHLKELEEDRKNEERELNELLEVHKKMIEKKQEEAICKLKRAREELNKNVLAGRAEQLNYKCQEAENHLKLKEAENELMRMAWETNERLQAEHDRLQAEQVKQYREDLKMQIQLNNEKRRLEKEQLERELAEGLVEEEKRRKHAEELIKARLEQVTFKHPFRRVLESPCCSCTSTH